MSPVSRSLDTLITMPVSGAATSVGGTSGVAPGAPGPTPVSPSSPSTIDAGGASAPFEALCPVAPARLSLSERVSAPLRLWHRAIRYRWKLNPGEIGAMLEILSEAAKRPSESGAVALDVGAHKGGYAFWMSRAVGAAGRVFAFEPQERVAAPAAAAFRAAGRRNVAYYHAAVSERSGTGTLSFLSGSTHGASLDGLEGKADVHAARVRTVSIDDFVRCVCDDNVCHDDGAPAPVGTCSILKRGLSRVDFLKIDVEGHEMPALRGARGAIERFRPAIQVEAESRLHAEGHDPVAEVAGFLEPFGYEGFFFRGAQRVPLKEFRHAEHQKYGEGFYSNNFLFVA